MKDLERTIWPMAKENSPIKTVTYTKENEILPPSMAMDTTSTKTAENTKGNIK